MVDDSGQVSVDKTISTLPLLRGEALSPQIARRNRVPEKALNPLHMRMSVFSP